MAPVTSKMTPRFFTRNDANKRQRATLQLVPTAPLPRTKTTLLIRCVHSVRVCDRSYPYVNNQSSLSRPLTLPSDHKARDYTFITNDPPAAKALIEELVRNGPLGKADKSWTKRDDKTKARIGLL